jgi:predicted nucleotidyltransferase
VAFSLAAGGVSDATMGLVADYLVGKAFSAIAGKAISSFTSFVLRGGAGAVAQNVAGITAEQAAKLRGILARIPGVEDVLAFGSRTKGTHTAESDLDIALIGEVNRYDPKTQALVREAQEYAKSIGVGLGKEGRAPLDIHSWPSVKEMIKAFRDNPTTRDVPRPVKLK